MMRLLPPRGLGGKPCTVLRCSESVDDCAYALAQPGASHANLPGWSDLLGIKFIND